MSRSSAPPRCAAPLVCVALALAGAATSASSAHAEGEPVLSTVLTGVQLTGATPSSIVTLTGTVTNAGPAPVTGARVSFWRSTARLRSAAAIDQALRADATPQGQALAGRPGQSTPLSVDGGSLVPGGTSAFTLTSSLADLGLTATDATFWIGVDAVGTTRPGAAPTTLGRGRTLLTLPSALVTPVAPLVFLTAQPRQISPNLFTDEGLLADLRTRLSPLVDAAATDALGWVIDPALYAEVVDMSDGYRVVAGTGTVAGTGAADAKAFLDDLRALPAARGVQTLFANPDLVGAAAAEAPDVLERALRAGQAERVPGLDAVTFAPTPDSESLALLQRAGKPVLTLTSEPVAAWAEHDGQLFVRAAVAAAPGGLVLTDSPVNRAAALLAKARVARGQVRLLTSAADVVVNRAATQWWTPSTDAFVRPAQVPPFVAPERRADPAPVVTAQSARDLRGLARDLAAYADAAPQAGLDDAADAAASRGAGLAWAGQPAPRAAWLSAIRSRYGGQAVAHGLTLDAATRLIMSSDSAEFPVTITNMLPDPVRVHLVAESDNAARVGVDTPGPVTIRPGASETVTLQARATANGVVTARIHVESSNHRRLTPDVTITIESTNLGLIGWIIVIVSGAVLLVSTVLRIRAVRAKPTGGGDD